MIKKILFGVLAIAVVASGVAAMSAFEAHVINVTAHIENALDVHPDDIAFGTVFPQEYLEVDFTVEISESFEAEEDAYAVDYVIKQKPKCCEEDEQEPGECLEDGDYAAVDYATHECPEGYVEMLSLCKYLSKMPDEEPEEGDVGHPSYYVDPDGIPGNEDDFCPILSADNARGVLSKTDQVDEWVVDLKVPPVKGYVGQDWPASCAKYLVEENDEDYGCDLWIEVINITRD